jgi:hypothetical protein
MRMLTPKPILRGNINALGFIHSKLAQAASKGAYFFTCKEAASVYYRRACRWFPDHKPTRAECERCIADTSK